MQLLVFGLGYSASHFVAMHGHAFEGVRATFRAPLARQAAAGVTPLAFDGPDADTAIAAAIATSSHVLVSIPPDDAGDPVLRRFERALRAAGQLRWIGYLSTIGVYGDGGGAWLDESAPLRPTSARNARRVEVEQAWLGLAREGGPAVQLFRLSGIYGPGRNAIVNLREGKARRIVKPGQVFNRIHVADIAGALRHGIERPGVGPAINVTDDEPAPPQDVIAHAAGLAGLPVPPDIPFDEAELTPMGRSFYGENKRVSNRRMREELGYALRYPTYREGLAACLAAEGH